MTLYVISFGRSDFCKVGQTQDWEQRLRFHSRGVEIVHVHYLNHDFGLREERSLLRFFRGKGEPWLGSSREMVQLDERDLALLQELKAPEDFHLALLHDRWRAPKPILGR